MCSAVFARLAYIFEENDVSSGPLEEFDSDCDCCSRCAFDLDLDLDCGYGCCSLNVDACDRRRDLCCGSNGDHLGVCGPFQYQRMSLFYEFLNHQKIFSVCRVPHGT